MIANCTEAKGNWSEIVLMALFFMRMTPCVSSGVSPILLKHGWEPNTPLQLLYKGWVQEDLGDDELDQWIAENTERVQRLRDKAKVNYKECSRIRKEKWDKTAKLRGFNVGDFVLMRKSGYCEKLSESWPGPYKVVKVNSPLSYQLDLGTRYKQSVHIQLLKKYEGRRDDVLVKKVTTFLDPDTKNDTMEHTYSEVQLQEDVVHPSREKDIQDWVTEFSDILTMEPGLTV